MPEKKTLNRARKAKSQGKAPSTQAGEFVREEMEHIRQGKHGARSPKQAIAIGLSKARRSGVKLAPPKKGTASKEVRKHAMRDLDKAQNGQQRVSGNRSLAVLNALKREDRRAASPAALSKQTATAAKKRTASDRSRTARRAVQTKGKAGLHQAAIKAAHTRMVSYHHVS